MKKRFSFVRLCLGIALFGGLSLCYLFLPQDTVFSDGIFSRFGRQPDGADVPERPWRRSDLSAALDAQLKKADLPPQHISKDDPRLDTELQVFASFAAQSINDFAGIAEQSRTPPNDAKLLELREVITLLTKKAEQWDKQFRDGSAESTSVRNILKWAQILKEQILENWQAVRSDQDYSGTAMAAYKKGAEKIVSSGQGFSLVFNFEPLGPGLKERLLEWQKTIEEIETFQREPANLDRLVAIHHDDQIPSVVREYAAYVYRTKLPLPGSLEALAIELARLNSAVQDPAYEGLQQFLIGRARLLAVIRGMVENYQKSARESAERHQAAAPLNADMIELVKNQIAEGEPYPLALEFVDRLGALSAALSAARDLENGLIEYGPSSVELCLGGWSKAVDRAAIFADLAVYPRQQREPFAVLARLLDEGVPEYSDANKRWTALVECRRNFYPAASIKWRTLYHFTRRPHFPLGGDRDSLQGDARQLGDPAEIKWAATMRTFLMECDKLPLSYPDIDALQKLKLSSLDGIRDEALESREAIQFCGLLENVRKAAIEAVEAESNMPDTSLDDDNIKAYAAAKKRLLEAHQVLLGLFASNHLLPWATRITEHVQSWAQIVGLFGEKETDAKPLAPLLARLDGLFDEAALGREPRFLDFIGAVRFQKTDIRFTPTLKEFADNQEAISSRFEALARQSNRTLLLKLMLGHRQIAAAAQAYLKLNQGMDFLVQEIGPGAVEGPPGAWTSTLNAKELNWWRQRRPDSEVACYTADLMALVALKYRLPKHFRETHMDAVNQALRGEDFEELCSELAGAQAKVRTKAGASMGAVLAHELGAFNSAQALESTGHWLEARNEYNSIAAKSYRSDDFKNVRLMRLNFMLQLRTYSIPAGSSFRYQTDYTPTSAMGRLGSGFKNLLGILKNTPGFAIINEGQDQLWIHIREEERSNDAARESMAQNFIFEVVGQPFQFNWAGGKPLNISIYTTKKPLEASGAEPLFPPIKFTGPYALFDFCRRVGLSPQLLGFPYLVPDAAIIGKILPPEWKPSRKNVENEVEKALELKEAVVNPLPGL